MTTENKSKLQKFVEQVTNVRESQIKGAAASSSGQHAKAREHFAEAKQRAARLDSMIPEINSILKGSDQLEIV